VPRSERYLVGLDVGTTKVAAIVGEVTDDGGVEIIGIGTADAKGIRRGAVVNLEEAVESIKKAIEEAELTAGIEIDSVYLTLSGAHIKGFNSRGVVAVSGKTREITREDVRRAIDAAKAFALPSGREILHVLPQDFAVDDEEGIADPVGMGRASTSTSTS
jgi:cell division protein FtsA